MSGWFAGLGVAPLIVTLTLEEAAQARFDAVRAAHFPAERLVVGAHVTLFHALPGELEAAVAARIAALCGETGRVAVSVRGLRFLGRGVAYALDAPEAARVRAALRAAFAEALTAQDRAAWSPHVTVQNKVAPAVARETFALLSAQPAPGAFEATGLALWRYRGGPWEAVGAWRFSGPGFSRQPEAGTVS